MRYWVGVISADHAKFAVKEGVCAFLRGEKLPVDKMSVGDRVVFYSPKTGVSEGETVQSFTAVGTVTGAAAYEKKWADTDSMAWVLDVDYTTFKPCPVKPIMERLSFIPNTRYWGMAFRRGHFEIPRADFELIEQQSGT